MLLNTIKTLCGFTEAFRLLSYLCNSVFESLFQTRKSSELVAFHSCLSVSKFCVLIMTQPCCTQGCGLRLPQELFAFLLSLPPASLCPQTRAQVVYMLLYTTACRHPCIFTQQIYLWDININRMVLGSDKFDVVVPAH